MNTDETDRPISQSRRDVRGVNEFNAGGSHEENPYGGVPQGIAPDGAPNLVEQGEVKLSDIIGMDNQYILSNRIIIDAEHAQQFNIPESVVGMTYAAAFKKLYQPLKERSGSTEVKNEIAHLANAFMQAQDSVKAEQEAQQASAIMNSLSPEERQQMMQMAQQQGGQGQPSPEEQQMMQQQMMQQQMQAQQQGQMAQDPSMMGGQQMPPEAMAAQGGQPSPEEMAMMQQQAPGMMGGQQPMMARGGRMINQFAKGGNINFNKSMFGGIFSHRFDEGGSISTDSVNIASPDTTALDSSAVKPIIRKPIFFNVSGLQGDTIILKSPNGEKTTLSKDQLEQATQQAKSDGDSTRLATLDDIAKQVKNIHEENNTPKYSFDKASYWTQVMPKIDKKNRRTSNDDIVLDQGSGWERFKGWWNGDKPSNWESYKINKEDRKNINVLNELARQVILGEMGTGHYRKAFLGDLYPEVMRRVNYRLKNGTYPTENAEYEASDGYDYTYGDTRNVLHSRYYDFSGVTKAQRGGAYMRNRAKDELDKTRASIKNKYPEDAIDSTDPLTMRTDSVRTFAPDSLGLSSDSLSLVPDSVKSLPTDSSAIANKAGRSLQSQSDTTAAAKDDIYDELMGENAKSNSPSNSETSEKKQTSQSSESDKSNSSKSIEGKSVEELADMVLKGRLGNGKKRKEALGDKYAEVQKLVNEKTKKYKAYKEKLAAKKVKIDDERGGKKEVEIPSWVGRADELNLEMNPIKNRIPKATRDISVSDDMIQEIPSEDTQNLSRYIAEHPEVEDKLDTPFDRLIRRARKANLRK